MRKLVTTLFVAILLMACTHKELCYNHPHTTNLNVQFDWSATPEKVPESMSVYFFKEDGSDPLRFEFTNSAGGRIRLSPGVYHVLCVNSDERSHMVQNNHDFDAFYLTTKDATFMSALSTFGVTLNNIPKAKNAQEERIVAEPLNVWHSNSTDIVVKDQTEQNITLTIRPQIKKHVVKITNAANLKWVYGVSATMSGLAGGLHPGRGELSEERVTIPFEAVMDKEAGVITASFTSFGHCPTTENPHYLKVYAVLADDSWWDFTYDVTNLMHEVPDEDVIYITLDELPIPKPVANGGGFQPTVGEWNSVEIEIKM